MKLNCELKTYYEQSKIDVLRSSANSKRIFNACQKKKYEQKTGPEFLNNVNQKVNFYLCQKRVRNNKFQMK